MFFVLATHHNSCVISCLYEIFVIGTTCDDLICLILKYIKLKPNNKFELTPTHSFRQPYNLTEGKM